MAESINLAGQRFGRLTVLDVAARKNGIVWRCLCDCGAETLARAGHLRAGSKASCGCAVVDAARENQKAAIAAITTHGISHSRLDHCYKNMVSRCYNPKNKRYDKYGARGIAVCAEWRNDKLSFFRWAMANGYADHLTIERDKVNGNYGPSNCRWATLKEQMNNQTNSVFLDWNGRRQTIAQWAEELGIKYGALQHRVDRGWSMDRIMTQPFRAPRYPRRSRDGVA